MWDLSKKEKDKKALSQLLHIKYKYIIICDGFKKDTLQFNILYIKYKYIIICDGFKEILFSLIFYTLNINILLFVMGLKRYSLV